MNLLYTVIVPHPPLIVPSVGKGEENKIWKTVQSYQKIANKIAELKPDTIVVISPHAPAYADYIHISPGTKAQGDFSDFGAPAVHIEKEYDTEFVRTLCELAESEGIPAGTLGEKGKRLDHGVLVPLFFLEPVYTQYRLVRLSISGLSYEDHYRFGQCIAQAAENLNRKTVIIASGDLSHKLLEEGPYGFAKEGPEFDKKVVEAMESGDFLKMLQFDEDFCDTAGECGLRSFIEMAGALDGLAVKPELLSYEGPFGVGYAVCSYDIAGADENRHFGSAYRALQQKQLNDIQSKEDAYVRLARAALEHFLKTGEFLSRPEGLPQDMNQRAGVFVSLKKNGQLRGCIGTIEPSYGNIAEEIIRNAVSAGTEDPRFDPVEKPELSSLVVSVDILSEPEPALKEQLDVKRYGVIVSRGRRRGLLLPNLPGVDTPERQIEIALQKAGIASHEEYQLERFEVVRHT